MNDLVVVVMVAMMMTRLMIVMKRMMMMMMMHSIETEGSNHDLNGLLQLTVDPPQYTGKSNTKVLY